MKSSNFIHPSDKLALDAIRDIPGINLVIKKFFEVCSERQYRAQCLATKVRLSPTQLPNIYNKLPPICKRLNIPVPEFFLEANVTPNASAFGETNPIICLTSGLITSMTDDEIESVIAHECGHIACHHMLYHSLAFALVSFASSFDVLGLALKPVLWALFKWSRCSELSADRAAAYALQSVQQVVNAQLRLSGGPNSITKHVDIEEFIKQADEFEAYGKDMLTGLMKNMLALNETHPFAAVRVREIIKWGQSWEYQNMIKDSSKSELANLTKKTCPRCKYVVDPQWIFCKHCGEKIG